MPLLDHFHAPLDDQHSWGSFHSNWATRLADALNDKLPQDFLVEEHTHAGGSLEIDIATFSLSQSKPDPASTGNGVVAVAAPAWAPPVAPHTMPAIFPDNFEVRVFAIDGGRTLVGAIELISPSNKDRATERRAFAAKCASYLHRGVSVIIVDIVTNRSGNLHNDTMRIMKADKSLHFAADVQLYAVAYRPVRRDERPEIDLWPVECAVGAPLPLLPLRLTGDLFVPVDFEATYQEACRRRRLG